MVKIKRPPTKLDHKIELLNVLKVNFYYFQIISNKLRTKFI